MHQFRDVCRVEQLGEPEGPRLRRAGWRMVHYLNRARVADAQHAGRAEHFGAHVVAVYGLKTGVHDSHRSGVETHVHRRGVEHAARLPIG